MKARKTMNTSNKLLLGLLLTVLLFITVMLGVGRYYAVEGQGMFLDPPAAPAPPAVPPAPSSGVN